MSAGLWFVFFLAAVSCVVSEAMMIWILAQQLRDERQNNDALIERVRSLKAVNAALCGRKPEENS